MALLCASAAAAVAVAGAGVGPLFCWTTGAGRVAPAAGAVVAGGSVVAGAQAGRVSSIRSKIKNNVIRIVRWFVSMAAMFANNFRSQRQSEQGKCNKAHHLPPATQPLCTSTARNPLRATPILFIPNS